MNERTDNVVSRVYLDVNVYEAALQRIEWVFSEFEHVYADISGGKDSTVIYFLALEVAEKLGRLPLDVLFVDQEAEWATVIDYIRELMHDPRVRPHWLQCPIRIFNATSHRTEWLMCWEEGAEWMRPKEPDAVHANTFGTMTFNELYGAFLRTRHPTESAAHLGGVRCEESPGRRLGLTTYETYKGETWGKIEDRTLKHYTWYPIYDWSYLDVWTAIHRNGWPYCRIYDHMYQHGVPVREMRVSNIHHETAVKTLFYLQEIEADTWDRATQRLPGLNTAGQLREQFLCPPQLPSMFADWKEYRDHLVDNLITDPKHQEAFRRLFAQYEERFVDEVQDKLVQTEIAAVLVNDYHSTKLRNFNATHFHQLKNRGARSGRGRRQASPASSS